MAYIGKSPTGTGVRSRYYFTATGGETSLSGASDSGATLLFTDGAYVDVSLNGIALVAGTDYNTTTANTIGGLSALAASDIVEILVYDTFTVADTVSASSGGTFSGGITIGGDLTVDTDTLQVDSTNNRVGIGQSSPNQKLDVNGNIVTDSYSLGAGNGIFLRRGFETNAQPSITVEDHSGSAPDGLSVNGGDGVSFRTGGTEHMRITSSGDVIVGDTSQISGGTTFSAINADGGGRGTDTYRATTNSTAHISNWYSDVGGTQTTQQVMEASGDIESRTSSFGGTSDRTLKENITDATNQWDDIKALEFKNYNFIGDPDRPQLGVIAQDVEAAGMTGLVKTSEETGKMSVKYSVLYMKAVIALQEAMTRIETLETERADLETRIAALENV